MNPSHNPPEPEREREPEREPQREREREPERSSYAGSESGSTSNYTDLPSIDEDPVKTDPGPKKKKSWLWPVVAAVCLLGAVGIGMMEHGSSPGGSGSPMLVQQQEQQVLTLSGADLDQAATTQAVADLKSGTSNPLLANLSDQVKQELLSGARQFYRVPMNSRQASGAASAQADSTDRVQINFNGATYGVYNLAKDPISLDMPLKMGDRIDVKCLSVATGKSTLTVDLATVLNPIQSEALAPGQEENLSVTQSATGQNYDWFIQEASQGNAVAQYGLGHMYQYGLGVAQDKAQAIHWYQQAAAQNYQDAQAQLAALMGSSQ